MSRRGPGLDPGMKHSATFCPNVCSSTVVVYGRLLSGLTLSGTYCYNLQTRRQWFKEPNGLVKSRSVALAFFLSPTAPPRKDWKDSNYCGQTHVAMAELFIVASEIHRKFTFEVMSKNVTACKSMRHGSALGFKLSVNFLMVNEMVARHHSGGAIDLRWDKLNIPPGDGWMKERKKNYLWNVKICLCCRTRCLEWLPLLGSTWFLRYGCPFLDYFLRLNSLASD